MDPVTIGASIAAGKAAYDNAQPLLSGAVKTIQKGWELKGPNSIIELTQPARNDFITVVEDSLIGLPYTADIMQSALSLVSGYYLSALTLIVDIPGIDILGTLDKLATHRDPMSPGKFLSKSTFGTESFDYGLPTGENQLIAAQEALGDQHKKGSTIQQGDIHAYGDIDITNNVTTVKQEAPKTNTGMSMGRQNLDIVKEVSNLSVGKMLEVNLERNGNKASVNVMMRLMVLNTDSTSMKTILTVGAGKNDFKERWYRMKAGELRFIQDIVFCQDLIKESRKTRINDKSGFFEHMMRQQGHNAVASLTGGATLNNSSAILVFTEETAKAVEIEVGGKLDNFKIREKVFSYTKAMLMFVVNRKWEHVTIYHQSIATPSEMSVRELKRAAKSSGADIEDILRAYTAGSAPAL
jgi:hypothetical protein